MKSINKLVEVIPNQESLYLEFPGQIVGRGKFDDVIGVANGEGFCRFKGVWNYKLIVFVGHWQVWRKEG